MTPSTARPEQHPDEEDFDDEGMTFAEMLSLLRQHLKLLLAVPLLAGAAALGLTYAIAPTFTATSTLLPPQQGQSAAASALASLGGLAGLAAGAAGVRSPGEQYVALMQSVTVSDRVIDRFKLREVYDEKFRVDTRKELGKNVRISLGKKDGLISIEVDDKSPQRAADMANRYVEELRIVTSTLAVTEAQQRRLFFEEQLKQVRDRLKTAQEALQASGFSSGALKAEPKAAAESYARLKAEVTAAEVRLQTLHSSLTDSAPEVRQQLNTLIALRQQLAQGERAVDTTGAPDYVGKYRDFKYQEALFDFYARQFELARADESREGALIQVVDAATPPERKSRPKRAVIAVTAVMLTLAAVLAFVFARRSLSAAS